MDSDQQAPRQAKGPQSSVDKREMENRGIDISTRGPGRQAWPVKPFVIGSLLRSFRKIQFARQDTDSMMDRRNEMNGNWE